MYANSKLNDLASDPSYVAAVQAFLQRLIANGHARSNHLRELLQLAHYGPDHPGIALRLRSVPNWADLTQGDLAEEWLALYGRVQATRD